MTETGSNQRRVFGGRYEIVRRIARGGMADVFLARDQLLDRPVALKVLFPELSVDPSFVERFRREAQNAARLSHPNIVSVYDWGEEGRTYYIVMELIEGKPLSVLLRENGPLAANRAATIGTEVAAALSFAHRNGVIHRDVKPGNVLIDERGSVKVTDFGIARARNTTENLTQTGAVMGTATYFSPEQAQGMTVDERSDVYSLGVLLYEMVAGRPPFQADNPVTIAYKHVRETPPSLSQMNRGIPRAYEAIVMEAMAKTPANRYPTADDLRADLERFNRGEVVHATSLGPPVSNAAMPRRSEYSQTTMREPDPERFLPKDSSNNVRTPLLVFLGILALLGIGAFVLLTNNSLTGGDKATVSVPAVVGRTVTDAQTILTDANLRNSVTKEDNSAAEGTVIRQNPGENVTVQEHTTIVLTVSNGPAPVTVPDVVGETLDDARATLTRAGLKVATRSATSDTVDQNSVISQEPEPDNSVPAGATVTLVISSGPDRVKVPNLVGLTQSTAARELDNAGLRISTLSAESDEPEGTVIRTSPDPDTEVAKGTTVTVTVSKGTSSTTSTTGRTTTTTSRNRD